MAKLSNLKYFIKESPSLLKMYRLIKNGYWFKRSYKKRINGKGNKIKIDGSAVLVNCKFNINGDYNEISINHSSLLKNVTFFIKGNYNKIKISDNVQFFRGSSLWIEDENCEIIGDNSTFEDAHLAATENNSKIIIGSGCMFAYDIDVRTGDSHSIIDSTTNRRINYAKDVFIGNHVWVASHVSILKGVNILSNSVVATRSVVTKGSQKENVLLGGGSFKIIERKYRLG